MTQVTVMTVISGTCTMRARGLRHDRETQQHVVLPTFDELPQRVRDKPGRKAFWSAITKLLSIGTVITLEQEARSRNKKKVLAPGRVSSACVRSNGVSACVSSPIPPSAQTDALGGVGLRGLCAGSETMNPRNSRSAVMN